MMTGLIHQLIIISLIITSKMLSSIKTQVLAIGASMLLDPILARITVNPQTKSLVDEYGRNVLFHGVNVVFKVAPYIPSDGEFDINDSLNAQDI